MTKNKTHVKLYRMLVVASIGLVIIFELTRSYEITIAAEEHEA